MARAFGFAGSWRFLDQVGFLLLVCDFEINHYRYLALASRDVEVEIFGIAQEAHPNILC